MCLRLRFLTNRSPESHRMLSMMKSQTHQRPVLWTKTITRLLKIHFHDKILYLVVAQNLQFTMLSSKIKKSKSFGIFGCLIAKKAVSTRWDCGALSPMVARGDTVDLKNHCRAWLNIPGLKLVNSNTIQYITRNVLKCVAFVGLTIANSK